MLAPLVRTLPASFIHAEVVRVSGAFVLKKCTAMDLSTIGFCSMFHAASLMHTGRLSVTAEMSWR